MERLKEKAVQINEWAHTPRAKKMMYLALVIVLVGWVIFRFTVIGLEHRMKVYNPARAALDTGTPVAVMEIKRAPGVIREPLTVKNNIAYVSGARASLLRAGQKVADGEIVSVASNIDLDTGMHVVRTRGVANGLQFAEFHANGYFIPVHAIDNGNVFIVRDGYAVRTPITISRQDMDTAYVTAGLNDGDIIIVSRIADGAKVDIKK